MRSLAVCLLFCAGLAEAQTTPEALGWLSKIYEATRKLSYTGTFVYQQGDRSETSRITRLAEGGADLEKLEALDGTPREIVRTRDKITCYLPDSRTVKIDRRDDRPSFPALLPERMSALAEHYTITKGEIARISGYECQTIVLKPKDDLRFGFKLWADVGTGMLLKARTFNDKGETVEQFSFTELAIGPVHRDKLKSRLASRSRGWRIEDASVSPADLSAAGWIVSSDLPGFRKIVEVRRKMHEAMPVGQVVYSDGLAAVSVFIEPMEARRQSSPAGMSSIGAINIYTRDVANHRVTVVGEAPAASVQRIGDTVEYRRPR